MPPLTKSPRWNRILLPAVVFIGFLVFGFSENVKGPALPRIQSDFSLSELQIGLLLALNSFGYLLACLFTDRLAHRIGIRWTTILAFVSMTVSGVLISVSASGSLFAGSYFLMYIGNGMLEIALAILAARIFLRNTGTMMNLAHFFYGLSSAAAPLAASSLMDVPYHGTGLGWRGMYLIMLALSLIPVIPALAARFPDEAASGSSEPRVPLRDYVKDPTAWCIVAILSFGVISELAVGGWLVNYMEKVYRWEPAAASGMLSAFFICFMLARLLLGPVTDRFGYLPSIAVFSAFSGLCSLFAVFTGENGAFLFAAAGIGIAPVYPTVMAFLSKRYPRSTGSAITFTVTLMGVSTVTGNLLIGFITDGVQALASSAGRDSEEALKAGLQAGYLFIGLCALLCTAFAILLKRRTKASGVSPSSSAING
ncbi:MFS transporter [Gorillibacterium sp. sgz5001074]|uniref:MFS transporter n=1 Tax=Gorillibacterium sp. sgz5001074 TaxID=3446695 RepID=UPI003F66E490